MIILDKALRERAEAGHPVQVAIVGAGYMGRGLALQILSAMPGLRLAAVSNRTLAKAQQAYQQGGVDDFVRVETVSALEDAVANGRYAVTDDAYHLAAAGGIDVVIEATGEVEFGARVVMRAIEHGKHVVLMNAELDATLGPILKVHADRAGVVLTDTDGDQPGVVMNLYRFVDAIGYRPVVVGNIKGMLDHYRTPETQRAFAEAHNQDTKMITSFADGTKMAMENVVMANATGFGVAKRGMYGPACDHVDDALDLFDLERFAEGGGMVDYVLGATPGPGVFVVGYNDHPIKRQYIQVFKMGEGPFYVFYTPYHLPHLEGPLTAARAALFGDAAVTPAGAPVCEVVAVAKRDLRAGEVLDGIGGFTAYGLIENAGPAREDGLLPMGLADGCRLAVDVPKDRPIRRADVEWPEGRFCDDLWDQQRAHFAEQPA